MILALPGCRRAGGSVSPEDPDPSTTTDPAAPTPDSPPTEPMALGLADSYACMQREGRLLCWGRTVLLPDGETARPEGLMEMPVSGVDQFAVGSDRVCVIADASLRCWGHDPEESTPPLEEGTTEPIEEVFAVLDPASVQIHNWGVCALDHGGALTCWTDEESDDDYHDEEEEPPWMEQHDMAKDLSSFAMGDRFACGILRGGGIECWGEDPLHVREADHDYDVCLESLEYEECDDEYDECDEYDPEEGCDDEYEAQLAAGWNEGIAIEGIPDPRSLVAGDMFACALTRSGRVFCWGSGSSGELGHGALADSQSPVPVTGLDDAIALAAGADHACAVREDGTVVCWGDDRKAAVGAKGQGTARPVTVPEISDALDVVLTKDLSCAITRTGVPRCWGHDARQRVAGRNKPTKIPTVSLEGVTGLVPFGKNSCASGPKGALHCWGRYDLATKEGVPSFARPRRTPHQGIATLTTRGPCALTTSGEARCWRAFNEMTQGGPSTLVVGGAVTLGAGKSHTCAATEGGRVRCWKERSGKAPIPTPVPGLDAIVDMAVGTRWGCGVRRDGGMDCWMLEASSTVVPTRVPRLSSAAEVTTTGSEFCVRTTEGRVRCWTQDGLSEPSFDHPIEGVEALTAGSDHTCALTGGEVWCWGSNSDGQLGSAAQGSSAGAVRVPELPHVVEIAAGDTHTCARNKDGAVRCWGRGAEGQLGRPPSSHITRPAPLLPDNWETALHR
jgi:alpha-tubulin suppressor-like RCC1 family protein